MEPDAQLRNLRDFLLVYNRMTEICFQRCSSNFNYRSLTMDEERCVDNCAGKLIRSNHRLMATYVNLMPRMVQRRMEEMESKAAENAKLEAAAGASASAGLESQRPPGGAVELCVLGTDAALPRRVSPVDHINFEERGVDFLGSSDFGRRTTLRGKGRYRGSDQ
ncbi:hypothetical protein WMY93_008492 [Mugilogobius chulae]|uniref:Mitochondrial import inner membrane translocase subunit Tim10 B n=1 Tax=Mugilogobius chulae TaxID=88201 RepID=A0AAW0PSP4_9GOBI